MDWDVYFGPLAYPYNLQAHRFTGITLFNLVLSRVPPSAVIETRASAHRTDGLQALMTAQLTRAALRRFEHALGLDKARLTPS